MAWEPAPVKTPVQITRVDLRFMDYEGSPSPGDENPGRVRKSVYLFEVEYDDGSKETYKGNLTPHLSAGEIDWLMSFMDSKIADIEAAVLP